jgi:hypothetical protein
MTTQSQGATRRAEGDRCRGAASRRDEPGASIPARGEPAQATLSSPQGRRAGSPDTAGRRLNSDRCPMSMPIGSCDRDPCSRLDTAPRRWRAGRSRARARERRRSGAPFELYVQAALSFGARLTSVSTAAALCSGARCAYRSVMATDLWPSNSQTVLRSTPAITRLLANVCRRS